jgi:enolase
MLIEAKLGANAILGVSMAATRAAAAEKVTTQLSSLPD